MSLPNFKTHHHPLQSLGLTVCMVYSKQGLVEISSILLGISYPHWPDSLEVHPQRNFYLSLGSLAGLSLPVYFSRNLHWEPLMFLCSQVEWKVTWRWEKNTNTNIFVWILWYNQAISIMTNVPLLFQSFEALCLNPRVLMQHWVFNECTVSCGESVNFWGQMILMIINILTLPKHRYLKQFKSYAYFTTIKPPH